MQSCGGETDGIPREPTLEGEGAMTGDTAGLMHAEKNGFVSFLAPQTSA